MKIHHILYAICICGTITSCQNTIENDRQIAIGRSDLKINVTDTELDSAIGEYVKKYGVDPKQTVLSLNVYRDPRGCKVNCVKA